jgi:hypothetical protein
MGESLNSHYSHGTTNEFGSDFHVITEYHSKRAHLTDVYRDVVLMADGRQPIIALVRQEGWRRLWMPEYFCYEVIDTIKQQTGIEIAFYPGYPLADDKSIVANLPYKEGDALLRVNFFGLRDHRSKAEIKVPVIEDHTHDLMGNWALFSDADWCIASLRKTLPLPEGGMLWSPKGHRLSLRLRNTDENQRMADVRWKAMQMKADYLAGNMTEKETFRKLYVETEEWFDTAEMSLIDEKSKDYIAQLDINRWQGAKRRNWKMLKSLITGKIKILQPEDESCTTFSLLLLAESMEQRDAFRRKLIESAVYPAILWHVPENVDEKVKDFSHRMLSIHCDGRYSEEDIIQLAKIINDNLLETIVAEQAIKVETDNE